MSTASLAKAISDLPKPVGYEVSNRITGSKNYFQNSRRATAFMDRKDNEYGSIITSRRAIWEQAEWDALTITVRV